MEQAQQLAGVLLESARQISRGDAAAARLQGHLRATPSRSTGSRTRATGSSREAIASLFDKGIDPMVVIRWKDIFERLEAAIDADRARREHRRGHRHQELLAGRRVRQRLELLLVRPCARPRRAPRACRAGSGPRSPAVRQALRSPPADPRPPTRRASSDRAGPPPGRGRRAARRANSARSAARACSRSGRSPRARRARPATRPGGAGTGTSARKRVASGLPGRPRAPDSGRPARRSPHGSRRRSSRRSRRT